VKVFDYDNLISNEKVFGLEIIDNIVKVLELKSKRGKVTVSGFGESTIDPKTYSEGIVLKQDAVAEAIKNAREQARPGRIKRKYAAVVLPDSKIFVRIVKFPAGMSKEEIKEAIEWKAKDLIAMPLEKVYWDWHRLRANGKKNDVENANQEIEVVLSAVEKKCVDSYTKMLQLLDIIPLYFDISGNAAARFLFQTEYKKKKALLVRVDRDSSTLSLFLHGGVRYQTIIKDVVKGGYGSLIDYAAAKLGIDKGKAEELILTPKNLNNEQKKLLQESFGVHYSSLLREVGQILDYYSQTVDGAQKKEEKNFAGIYLYGKGAKIYYLKEFFEKKSYKVEVRPETKSLISPMLPFISKQGLSQNLVLLGLSLRNLEAFRDYRDINLVPKRIKSKYLQTTIYSSLYRYLRVIFWNVFIVGIVLTFTFIISLVYRENAKGELRSVENVTESRANQELRDDIEQVNQTAHQIDALYNTQLDWNELFIQISTQRAGGISLTNLVVSEESEIWQAISGQKKVVEREGFIYLVMGGIASNREDLHEYMNNLEGSELFEDVKMPISNYEENEDILFTIYCLVDTSKLNLIESSND
jgi:type IV pilus assembly protein PilM